MNDVVAAGFTPLGLVDVNIIHEKRERADRETADAFAFLTKKFSEPKIQPHQKITSRLWVVKIFLNPSAGDIAEGIPIG